MNATVIVNVSSAMIEASLPLLFAALGALICERVGVFNYGLEGVMLVGAALGFIVALETGSPGLGIVVGGLAGGLFSFVFYAVSVVLLRASLILMSFALWFLGVGLSGQLGDGYTNVQLPHSVARLEIPLLADLPIVGPILFRQIWPLYLGIALVVLVWAVLTRTRHGLNLRALGEDPGAAYASGVNVQVWRIAYLSLGGVFMGLGGAVLSVAITRGWQSEMTAGRGFIALALVIFASWRPLALLWTSAVLGLMIALANLGQVRGWALPSEVLSMAPYLLTIVILVLQTTLSRARGGGSPVPAALGADFYRGQR